MKLLFIVLAEKRTRRCWGLDGSLCQHRSDEELALGWVAGDEHPCALGMRLGSCSLCVGLAREPGFWQV